MRQGATGPRDPSFGDVHAFVEDVLLEEALRFVREVPRARQLTDTRMAVDEAYYLRHRIETVKRIRCTARTDALALAAMVEEDYEAARIWARYTVEELNHDRMFLADLARHGVTEEQVLAVPPMRSTQALIAFLVKQIAEIGSIAAVAYSIFVEWNSARYSRRAVEVAEAAFGADLVRGSKAHLEIDVDEDHYAEMIRIAHRLVSRSGSAQQLASLIRAIAAHLRDYFTELHEATAARSTGAL